MLHFKRIREFFHLISMKLNIAFFNRNVVWFRKDNTFSSNVREILGTCALIVRWQSNERHKLFTDSLNKIWVLPIVVEVGSLWRCLSLLEVTSMNSEFLILSFSMFAIAQALTYHMHNCIEWSSSSILSGGADICNSKSFAIEWSMIVCVDNCRQSLNIHGEEV